MVKYILVVILFFVSGCASSKKADVHLEESALVPEETSIANNTPQGSTDVSGENFSKETIDKFFKHSVDTPLNFDLSEYRDEREIEIKSQSELSQIQQEFLEFAKSKMDPDTGSLNGVLAPIHAVTVVHSADDIKTVTANFQSIGTFVSTFEVRFASDFDADAIQSNSVPRIELSRMTHGRLMISGSGNEPVNVGDLSFTLRDGIVQISNLQWNNTTSQSTKMNITVDRLFHANKLLITNIKTYHSEPSAVSQNSNDNMIMGGGIIGNRVNIQRRPIIELNAFGESAMHPSYSLESIYSDNNDVSSILEIQELSRDKFTHASIRHVFVKDNVFDYGFDISVMTDVFIENVESVNNSGTVFLQHTPKAHVKVINSKTAANFYRFSSSNPSDVPPTVEYK